MSELQRVGPSFGGTGTAQPFTADFSGGQRVADAHGRYADAARRGNVFVASNTAAQAVSVALNTTYTGLCLSNTLGSGKNLELLGVGFALSVAPAAIASLHLIGGYSTTAVVHTTPIVGLGVRSTLLSATNLTAASVDSAATIPTPTYLLALSHGFTAAALPNHNLPYLDLGGLIVIPPGGFVCIGALTAVTGFGTFVWEETPILA